MQIHGWEWVLLAWATSVCALQCAVALYLHINRFVLQKLGEAQVCTPDAWPKLSVIIPARNEGHTLEPALSTLLEQRYPNLEIVLVDDRSTDETSAIVDRMAEDPRIVAIHIDTLPAGWLGKVHALHRGVQAATGDFYLFSDADVHFGAGALETAVAWCLDNERDFLAVLPSFERHGPLFDATMTAFGVGFSVFTKPHLIGRDDTDAYFGVGAFNMVRADAFARSEGFAWLRLEIADDIGFGLLMKRAGAKAAILDGGDLVSVDWYPSVREMVRGLEKNSFPATARFSLLRLAVLAGFMMSSVAAPFAAVLHGMPVLALVGVVALLATAYVHIHTGRLLGVPALRAIGAVFGVLVLTYALLRSAAICYARGGIRWRDTWYPMAELRACQRVKL